MAPIGGNRRQQRRVQNPFDWRLSLCRRGGQSDGGRAAAAWAHALQLSQSPLELSHSSMQPLDLSIPSIRCSSSGLGPRRISGPGASSRLVIPGARGGREQHFGRPGPQRQQRPPCLLRLAIRCQRCQLAAADRDPVARELRQVQPCAGPFVWIRGIVHPPSDLLAAADHRGGGATETGFRARRDRLYGAEHPSQSGNRNGR
jgi:hypothetical protein